MKKLINLIAALSFVFFSNGVAAGKFDYVLSDISELYYRLQMRKVEGSWGAFAPHRYPEGVDAPLNIQFSFEKGAIGMDWVLSSPANIKGVDALLKYAHDKGYDFNLITAENGFRYLRSIDVGVDRFCLDFLKDEYGYSDNEGADYFSGGY